MNELNSISNYLTSNINKQNFKLQINQIGSNKNQSLLEDINIKDLPLPEYLFLPQVSNNHDENDALNSNEIYSVDKKEKDPTNFNCSTPTKSIDFEDFNDSISQQYDNEVNLSTKEPIKSSNNKTRDHNVTSYSLIEFEEIEKKVDEQSSSVTPTQSTTSLYSASSFKSPINQVETLLNQLRNNYDPKTSETCPSDSSTSSQFLPNQSSQNKFLKQNQVVNQNQNMAGFFRKTDHLAALETRLESEIFRRQHCEKQIHDLNENVLELQQQLAVARGLEKKRDVFCLNMDVSLRKITDSWRQKEIEMETIVDQLKNDIQHLIKNESQLGLKVQMLEKDLKRMSDDLINERVKSQEYQNEISNLKAELNKSVKINIEDKSKIEESLKHIEQLEKEKCLKEEKIIELNIQLEENKKENEKFQINFSSQMNELKKINQNILNKYEKLKIEYETLINEAKMVVDESEKQYNQLIKNIEAEKMKKDTLQVEINVLEEKLGNSVNEYENKIIKIKEFALENEKSLKETHRLELEQFNLKQKTELEKLKSKYFDDLQEKTNEYEMKLTDLNLKIDSYRNQIDRLNLCNKDLENDRNTIRQNLKQMFEIQMKETMQLLGINNTSTAKTSSDFVNSTSGYSTSLSSIYSSDLNKIKIENSINAIQDASTLVINKMDNNAFKTSSPKKQIESNQEQSKEIKFETNLSFISKKQEDATKLLASVSLADLMISSFKKESEVPNINLNEKTESIKINSNETKVKDSFILNQIDLINKYYQIDNQVITAAVTNTTVPSSGSMSNLTNLSASFLNTSNNSKKNISLEESNKKQQVFANNLNEISDQNNKNNNRSNELRHYIEVLLNRSPTESVATTTATIIAPINQAKNLLESQPELAGSDSFQSTPKSIYTNLRKIENQEIQPKKPQNKIEFYEKLIKVSGKQLPSSNFDRPKIEEEESSSNENLDANFSTDFQNEEIEDDNLKKNSKIYDSKHDLSDLELGYCKREPSEYYDDVKRTLKFDDDEDTDEDDDDDELINDKEPTPRLSLTSSEENEKTSSLSSSSANKKKSQFFKKHELMKTKKQQLKSNLKSKSLNSSMSVSLNSIASAVGVKTKSQNKNSFTKQGKEPTSNHNHTKTNTNQIKNSNSKTNSMISLNYSIHSISQAGFTSKEKPTPQLQQIKATVLSSNSTSSINNTASAATAVTSNRRKWK